MRLGIVAGLAIEARIARGLGGLIAVGGGGAEGGRRAAELLLARGADALLSFGYAGGLDPALPPGAVLVPARVVVNGTQFPTDLALTRALGGATVDAILGGSDALADTAAKRRARDSSGAAAVDLESGAVAAIAAVHRLPFGVLRAICDPADRALPAIALRALDPSGRPRIIRLLAELLRHPGNIPPLITLGRDASAAKKSLTAMVRQIGRIG